MAIGEDYDLMRFTSAQAPVFDTALSELRSGTKRSHWMWFVFPQLRGLGHSHTATFYGIACIEEARAYLAHRILGERLAIATRAMLGLDGRSAHDVFGSPDDLKFRSSMTLFNEAVGSETDIYRQALNRYFDGQPDKRTLALLHRPASD